MKKLKSFFGYFIAALGVPALLVLFMGSSTWMNLLVSSTGLEINPLYTGGHVARSYQQDGMQISIHEPVFAALIGESREGFVQIDFGTKPAAKNIDTDVDYDNDGQADFRVTWDTSTQNTVITPLSPLVLGLEGTFELDKSYAIRVRLKNPERQ
jgi:hypothetical protein